MTKPMLIILNAHADRQRAGQRWRQFQQVLNAHRAEYDLWKTDQPGAAIALARRGRQQGYPLIIAAGGDGTLNEVINGILAGVESNAHLPTMGIMPIGSANDLADILNIPLQPEAWYRLIQAGQPRRIDIGEVNGRYFGNNVGIGFEAQVNVESRRVQRLHGALVYLIGVFRALLKYNNPQVEIRMDSGQRIDGTMLLISVGNGRRAGGSFWLTPLAEVDDGQLDFTFAKGLSRLQIMRLLPKAINGRHINDPAVITGQCRELWLESATPLQAHTDGEILTPGARRFHIRILPGSLAILAPHAPLKNILT